MYLWREPQPSSNKDFCKCTLQDYVSSLALPDFFVHHTPRSTLCTAREYTILHSMVLFSTSDRSSFRSSRATPQLLESAYLIAQVWKSKLLTRVFIHQQISASVVLTWTSSFGTSYFLFPLYFIFLLDICSYLPCFLRLLGFIQSPLWPSCSREEHYQLAQKNFSLNEAQ